MVHLGFTSRVHVLLCQPSWHKTIRSWFNLIETNQDCVVFNLFQDLVKC